MCRNITVLRGLDPPATAEEIRAAATQYVRKVSGVQLLSPANEAAFERAVDAVARATAEVLAELPPRRTPPPTTPPLRRRPRDASAAQEAPRPGGRPSTGLDGVAVGP